ncbi:MAG TPA: SDR family oxidoreductase [Bryobacteraceae bacterium]|jgi:putative NADH-flavin reductase
MRLFILGATGGIGRHLVRIGLERDHEVTAYVRSPEKIPQQAGGLKVVRGDVFNAPQMAESMAGHAIVLSAFGPTTIRSSRLRRSFGHELSSALRQSSVHRVQLVSAAFLFRDVGLLGALLKPTLFRQMIPDMAGMEREIENDALEWTIIRPPRLTNGPATHKYRTADGELPKAGSVISRADVAEFMIREAERPEHTRQIVGVAE